MKKEKRYCILLILIFSLIGNYYGCTKQEKLLSDSELYTRGVNAFEKEKYQEARKHFQDIETLYPESRHLSLARIGIANTYFEEGAYDEAIIEYQKILEFYPLGKLSDWSQYRIGMSHFRQILKEDRDQEETRKACSSFEKFLTLYSKSPLIDEAQEKYRVCRDRLAGNNLYIAKFYFQNRAFEAAINRLEEILTHDPNFTHKDEALYYLANCYNKVGNSALEKETVQVLRDKYQDSKFTQKIIKDLDIK